MLEQWIARFHGGGHPGLTAYFSLHFLVIFLPPSILAFAVAPRKLKKYVLLACSLGFYWLVGGEMILYLFLGALSAWGFGIWLQRLNDDKAAALKMCPKEQKKALKQQYQSSMRRVLTLAICLHVGLLLVLKYTGFFVENLNAFLKTDISAPAFLKPLGISFFTLEVVAYLTDVCRGTVRADTNYLNILLFMSFFPKIVEGPICRYAETSVQLRNVDHIRWENLTGGAQRILYGLMKKMVVADRLDAFVGNVFAEPESYPGGILLLAAVCYTIELYMDFSGSMDAVCGVGQILGVCLPENFRQPFFSRTVSEFWTRWHITLGTWFRDYVFYPVGISGGVKKISTELRKKAGNNAAALFSGAVALFCVWSCNGLWHGAAWNYVFFGMYHFIIILAGTALAPWNPVICQKLHIDSGSTPYRGMQHVRTCLLVVIGELFFRADTVSKGFVMVGKILTDFNFRNGYTCMIRAGIDGWDLLITAVTCVVVLGVGLLHEKSISVRKIVAKRPTAIRWAVWLGLILFVIIFGAYGAGYVPVDPMYADF